MEMELFHDLKQLNLEKARLAALTGDYETLTKEIAANVGDFNDFSKMNVLQQKALAESVGMTVDQLSDQLLAKANLNELAEEANLDLLQAPVQPMKEPEGDADFDLDFTPSKDVEEEDNNIADFF